MIKTIISGLENNVVKMCADSNANHVISQCIDIKPKELCLPLYEEIIENCIAVSSTKNFFHLYPLYLYQDCKYKHKYKYKYK